MNDYGFLMHALAAIATVWGVVAGLELWSNLNDYRVRTGMARVNIKWWFFTPYAYMVIYVFWLFS
jgi:hypothetical protein